MSYTVKDLWSEPVDSSRSIPITLVMDDNLPLLARDREVVYNLASKSQEGWNYYRTNAVTETTLSLYQWLRFQLGCRILTKHGHWFRAPKKYRKICAEAYDLLESGRIIKWRLF